MVDLWPKIMIDLKSLTREDLEREFEVRKAALIEVRDELDRRDRMVGRPGVEVDYCKYVEEDAVE